MAADLFNRYVWLLDLVERSNGITFEKIDEAWQRSRLNKDGVSLPKRTLYNHINAIEEMFGLEIYCRRQDDYKYYVREGEDDYLSEARTSLLNQLRLSNAMMNSSIAGRIVTNRILHERFFSPVMAAMDESKNIHVVYRDFAIGEESEDLVYTIKHVTLSPYMLRQMGEFRWYLIGLDLEDRLIHAFDLSHIEHIGVVESTFTMPKEFTIDAFVENLDAKDPDCMCYDDSTFATQMKIEKFRFCDIWSGEVI